MGSQNNENNPQRDRSGSDQLNETSSRLQNSSRNWNQRNDPGDNNHQHARSGQRADDDADQTMKSQEEILFDEQFRKWEEQFMNWKRDNANHPDRRAYLDYESKMEECREKLLQKRTEIRGRRFAMKNDSQKKNEKNNFDGPKIQNENVTQTENSKQSTAEAGTSKSVLFEWKNSNNSIPGLDLVSETSTTSLAINTILEDPKIKSLLNTIQQQQGQNNDNFQQDMQQTIENEPTNSESSFNEVKSESSYSNKVLPLMSLNVSNPTENQNEQSDSRYLERSGSENEMEAPVRSRRRRGGAKQRQKRLRRQMLAEASLNENHGMNDQLNDTKRQCSWPPNHQSQDFHRSQPILDNQNQSQIRTQAEFDLFPRKIIDYKHRSKLYTLTNFNPVKIVDYNHRSEDDMNIDLKSIESKNSLFPWRRLPKTTSQQTAPVVAAQLQRPHSILSRIPALLQSFKTDLRPGWRREHIPPPLMELYEYIFDVNIIFI